MAKRSERMSEFYELGYVIKKVLKKIGKIARNRAIEKERSAERLIEKRVASEG